MAGSEALAITRGRAEEAKAIVAVTGDEWEVQYSRFFRQSSAAAHPAPSPLLVRAKSVGTWISTSSFLAVLKVCTDRSTADSILTITFSHKVLEEHYISKLHFTWPQVSCLSGYPPPRGSRVVLLSYKDHECQIQKFAVCFLTYFEAERFINSLKAILDQKIVHVLACDNSRTEITSQTEFICPREPIALSCDNSRSELSFPSEFIPCQENVYRPMKDWSPATSGQNYVQQLHPRLNYDVCQNSDSQETIINPGNISAFPPSFTSLLRKYCPETEQAMQPVASEEVDLKMEITKYLGDSSFQDMLSKVQKVISEIGDDLLTNL